MLNGHIFVLFSIIFLAKSQENEQCTTKQSCGECIRTFGCMWCSEPFSSNVKGLKSPHCKDEKSEHVSDWCPLSKLTNEKSIFSIVKDEMLGSNSDGSAVQIKPQKVQLKLRKGEEFTLQFQYRQAENYPVDLYYIMDLSASMEEHREKLAKLGGKLVEVMRNITSNFKLGFGSFVDKVDIPFVSTVPSKLQSPCAHAACLPPYSFKNHMSLNDDHEMFAEEVSKARVSGNIDLPEGGFDAIMQAIVCAKEIGWRDQARHIIVFSTDAQFHIAGDGKLAGIVEPNDARCHMNDNLYTHDSIYDYPSVSQINHIAKMNNINLIFAIVNKSSTYDIYEKLQQRIENSAVGALTKDSSNVVNLVQDNYQKIVDSVSMEDNSGPDVQIEYNPQCPNAKLNGCNNIHVGEIVNFTVTIKPVECTETGMHTVKIKPKGLDEGLTVDLQVICNCECEHRNHTGFIANAPQCKNRGDLKCGVCDCDPGNFGKNCECNSLLAATDDVAACRKSPDDPVCSNLGDCVCGVCECLKRPGNDLIYGQFCECDNYSCVRSNGLICSGSEHGTCDCGVCNCLAGWTGDACECSDTNVTCTGPGDNDKICSGRGSCICGQCQCDIAENNRYSGKYCQECPTCPEQKCEELRHCVECQTYQTGIYDEQECAMKCTNFTTVIKNDLEDDQDESTKICKAPDNSGCTIIFSYTYSREDQLIVRAEPDKKCSADVDVFALALKLIGSTISTGIIMIIIWKVCTTVHDRREYAKFEDERANAKWSNSDNPLYVQATSEYRNPTYQQN